MIAPTPERIAELRAALASGKWPPPEITSAMVIHLCDSAARLVEAERLLHDTRLGLAVNGFCATATKTVPDSTDSEDLVVGISAGATGSCGQCHSCRVAAFLSPTVPTSALNTGDMMSAPQRTTATEEPQR